MLFGGTGSALGRRFLYGLSRVMIAAVVFATTLLVAGVLVKKAGEGRVAPGVAVCGRDVSGMSEEELARAVETLVPETVTELRCRFLPELREETEARVISFERGKNTEDMSMAIQGNELCLTVRLPMFRVDRSATVEAVRKASREVKAWEWLYGRMTGQAFRERSVQAVFAWDGDCFADGVAELQKAVEREAKEATIAWENGKIRVTESERGFRLNTEQLQKDMVDVIAEAVEQLKTGPMEALVLRFYVGCRVESPRLSAEQAKTCDTVIGAFATSYSGAGGGRVQNIENGAQKLHGKVILPGEEFSAAAALMPFTETNGYASGGTYIDGQLSESIGGGVCQLSTTLYNALLQTKLNITMRYPHSLPVGYVPLGLDAAIAGDYKDLRFVNNTETPVLLLCKTTKENVKVTVYGPEEARREAVTLESVVTEKTEEGVTVEVYRTEKGEKGETVREKVSRDRYKER